VQKDLYEVTKLVYKNQIAELRFLASAKKLELSKQKNLELKKRGAEVILLLAAKERELEKVQWDLLNKLAGPSRGRSQTL
jgi:hypothetical protein